MKSRLSQVLLHTAGCVTFLALPIVFSPDAHNPSDLWKHPPALKDFLVYLALLLFFYFNYFWLIPNYYFKRKYTGLFLITLLCFCAIVLVPNMLIGFRGNPPRAGYEWPANNPMPMPSDRPPRDLHQPPPMQQPANVDSIPSYGHESTPSTGRLLDVSHQLFLFLAVFFFSLILKINHR